MLEIVVSKKLDTSQQCILATQKTNHILGYLKISVSSRLREELLPLYSAMVKPHLKYHAQLPQHKRDVDLVKWIQRRANMMTRRLKHLSYEGRLGRVAIVQCEEEKAPGRPYNYI